MVMMVNRTDCQTHWSGPSLLHILQSGPEQEVTSQECELGDLLSLPCWWHVASCQDGHLLALSWAEGPRRGWAPRAAYATCARQLVGNSGRELPIYLPPHIQKLRCCGLTATSDSQGRWASWKQAGKGELGMQLSIQVDVLNSPHLTITHQ
jgi:hypothetical protein